MAVGRRGVEMVNSPSPGRGTPPPTGNGRRHRQRQDPSQPSSRGEFGSVADGLVDGAGGVYVNFLDSDDDSGRVREAYGDHIYRLLAP